MQTLLIIFLVSYFIIWCCVIYDYFSSLMWASSFSEIWFWGHLFIIILGLICFMSYKITYLVSYKIIY
jgi:hypothetical protein